MDSISANQHDKKRAKIAVSLYRHIIWVDALRRQFEIVLARDQPELGCRLQAKEITFEPKLLETEMYLCLWLGCLYSVIEGWPNLNIDEPTLTKLLDKGYKKMLYGFRNATFHPTDYDDARIHTLAAEGQKSIDWAREITFEFKSFLESILIFPG